MAHLSARPRCDCKDIASAAPVRDEHAHDVFVCGMTLQTGGPQTSEKRFETVRRRLHAWG